MNFKFYRENKIDQEYELSLDDLKSQYQNYI